MREGELTPRELVELCLERIARLDPQLNAFRIVYTERALAEADQASARRRAGGERPLLGVPVAIKDTGPTPSARRPARTRRWSAACAPPGRS